MNGEDLDDVQVVRALMPRPGRRPLTRRTALWHAWLSTLHGKDERTGAPAGDVPTEWEEPGSLGTVLDQATVIDWQKLWLLTQRRPWRSLAVVPADAGIATARVARALAEVGSSHLRRRMMVTDATRVSLEQVSTSCRTECGGDIHRILLALGPVQDHPASLALARAADAAILCLTLGESSISKAARTIEEVGPQRFLGSVILRPDKEDLR